MGFEEVESYMVKGVYNLSALVLDPSGRAMAALTVPFLAKLNSNRSGRKHAREHLVKVSEEISKSIGGTEYWKSYELWTESMGILQPNEVQHSVLICCALQLQKFPQTY